MLIVAILNTDALRSFSPHCAQIQQTGTKRKITFDKPHRLANIAHSQTLPL